MHLDRTISTFDRDGEPVHVIEQVWLVERRQRTQPQREVQGILAAARNTGTGENKE